MKKILFVICAIFICTFAFAQTIRWHVGDSIIRTDTCSSGDSVTPPTAPAKTGYHLAEWLPYQRIEYLESTGTQYIDTGVVPNLNTTLKASVAIQNSNTVVVAFGSRSSGTYDTSTDQFYGGFGGVENTDVWYYSGTQQIVLKNKYQDRTFFDFICSNSNATTAATQSITLFGLNKLGTVVSYAEKMKTVQIYNNNTLVRDFIPVLDSSGVPCMYDKVTKQFFYNQGTGQFIAGPVIQ